MPATPLPPTLEELLDTLTPWMDQQARAIMDRVAQKVDGRTWSIEPGRVISVEGEIAEVEPASDPGTVQYATRAGGSAPVADQTCLLLNGPHGRQWALCVIATP